MPVTFLVHNPSSSPVEVEVEVNTSEARGARAEVPGDGTEGDADPLSIDEASPECDPRHVMWSGMPR